MALNGLLIPPVTRKTNSRLVLDEEGREKVSLSSVCLSAGRGSDH